MSLPKGSHFNYVYKGVCGNTIGILTLPQTKVGLSINKNRPILRVCIVHCKYEPKLTKLQQVLIQFHENHPFAGRIMYQTVPSLTVPQGDPGTNSHVPTARGVGFSPNFLCPGSWVLNWRKFHSSERKIQ